MKNFIYIFAMFFSALSAAAETGETEFKNCQAPSEPFFMEKIKESYMVSSGEKRLKDIVLDQKNYPYREEIKELKLKLSSSSRDEKEQILKDIEGKFDQMVWNLETNETITQFPTNKSTSTVKGTTDSALMISMDNLSQEQVDFLPPEILKKLSKTVKIHYQYPEKKFSYFLSYGGEELPLQKVAGKIQKEFEVACQAAVVLNRYRKTNGNTGSSGQ